jgi:hypothetical protein
MFQDEIKKKKLYKRIQNKKKIAIKRMRIDIEIKNNIEIKNKLEENYNFFIEM